MTEKLKSFTSAAEKVAYFEKSLKTHDERFESAVHRVQQAEISLKLAQVEAQDSSLRRTQVSLDLDHAKTALRTTAFGVAEVAEPKLY